MLFCVQLVSHDSFTKLESQRKPAPCLDDKWNCSF